MWILTLSSSRYTILNLKTVTGSLILLAVFVNSCFILKWHPEAAVNDVKWQRSTGRSHRDWGKTLPPLLPLLLPSCPVFERIIQQNNTQVSGGFSGILPAVDSAVTFFSQRCSHCSLPRGWRRLASVTAAKHGGLSARRRNESGLGILEDFKRYLDGSHCETPPLWTHYRHRFLVLCGGLWTSTWGCLSVYVDGPAPSVFCGPWIIVVTSKVVTRPPQSFPLDLEKL